ncbi:DUF4377 domain-containing protein [Morganella morganii subsp. morganii]|uniref:DUF4377 domain-containing protein n=1 Tax=Morganella morganii TaxID=582 RepID=UPI001BD92738|nr:DUF4377 domain-containing protein [Morganella morganii]MBT0310511.1 DUF4377 domain-containing protein [Morganella morganii subsp. morganii]
MKSAYVIAPLFLLMAGCSQNARTDQAAENTRTLYIDSELADCVGVAPMKCMKIKESPDTEWEFFYQNIDGFTYEPGYQYRVSVKTTDVPNPPADAPNIRYQLISVLNKDPVPAKDAKIGMANPASVYCEQSGGKTETVKAASGWTGYCNLPGGERVEEWTYYRKNHK